MNVRFMLFVAGAGLIAAGLIPLNSLFRVLDLYENEPFQPRPWAAFMAAQAGMLVLGGCALAGALLPPLRRPWFAAVALLAAGGVSVLRFPQVYPTVAFNSLHRLAYWRNGSELFLAKPEFLAWSDEFAAWLEARPNDERMAYSVFISMGDYHLRVGNTAPAITYFEKALASLEANRAEIERESELAFGRKRLEALRWLITAHLRAGERDNCIKQRNQDSCIFPLRGGGVWVLNQHALDAQRLCLEYLAENPGSPGVRYLYNVAHMAAGTWPAGVEERYRLPLSPMDGVHAMPRFTNVAFAVGVGHESISGGAIIDDFDGDGDLDLFATCLRQDTNCMYYRNEGDGRFTDATEAAGLIGITGGLSCSQADVDGDGDRDILITRGAWLGEAGQIPNILLRNLGDGRFEDVSEASGVAAVAWPCLAASWCDYDLDGDMDVYIGDERLARGRYAPGQLLQNDGTGRFTDVAKQAGVENMRHARGVSWGDYDNDGDFDLYVSNFGELNRLYRNRGDGTFEDVAVTLGVAEQAPDPKRQRSFQSWFFDFNNDGWLDVFSASNPLDGSGGSVDVPASAWFGEPATEETCQLWINDRKGGFTNVSKEAGLTSSLLVMGANVADLDADGWTDFYLATGSPAFEMLVPNMVMRNVGGKLVADATVGSGLGHLQKGHGVSFGDVDNDGDLDLWAQLGGWFVDDRAYKGLFRNNGLASGTQWLTLRLRGDRSNHFGVGAVVKAVILEDGAEREIYALVGSGASFGASSLDLELGLGRASKLLRVEIRWPRPGSLAERTQVLTDLPMKRFLEVREAGGWTDVTPAPIPLAPELH